MPPPPGINFLNPRDRQYCVYPDGNVGEADGVNPYLFSFDAFNPKQLTGLELAKRYNPAEVAVNAEEYARQFHVQATALMSIISLDYNDEGRFIGRQNSARTASKLREMLGEDLHLPQTSQSQLLGHFMKAHAEKLGMDYPTTAMCERALRAAAAKHGSEQNRELSALADDMAVIFEARGEIVRRNLGPIATALRETFG